MLFWHARTTWVHRCSSLESTCINILFLICLESILKIFRWCDGLWDSSDELPHLWALLKGLRPQCRESKKNGLPLYEGSCNGKIVLGSFGNLGVWRWLEFLCGLCVVPCAQRILFLRWGIHQSTSCEETVEHLGTLKHLQLDLLRKCQLLWRFGGIGKEVNETKEASIK